MREAYTSSSQYERSLYNQLNSEDLNLPSKIRLLQKGIAYLNSPQLVYLFVHYSLENTAARSEAHYYYYFQLLRVRVLDKLDARNRLVKKSAKLLVELLYVGEKSFPQWTAEPEIRQYLTALKQRVHYDFTPFEQQLASFTNNNAHSVRELAGDLTQFRSVKFLFVITGREREWICLLVRGRSGDIPPPQLEWCSRNLK